MKSSKHVAEVACSEEQIFMTKYNDVFDGLGKFPFKHHITIKADAKPSIRPARRVPFRLKDRLKKALGELENRGVIARVDEPTEWVSNLVIAEKPNGSLRVCLDPKFLNEAIERERTYIPTRDDIKTALQGKKIFTVMDMKDGFYHIELDEESSKLCTFSSPFGRYRFLRMPFGISSAPEVFQKCSTSAFDGIEGVVVYFDDVIVAAESEERHDELLKEVMEKAKQFGVKFNKSKMQFKQKSVKVLRTLIPSTTSTLKPALPENIGNKIEESQKKQALNYDKSAVKKKQDLCTQVGQRVLVREGSIWIPKKLVGPAAVPRSFYVEGEDGRQLKRNSRWIRQFTQGQDRSPSSSSQASHSSQPLTNRRYPTRKQSNKL
ncbi:unnamed protein product, partial [Nesidiocoris tenuis]